VRLRRWIRGCEPTGGEGWRGSEQAAVIVCMMGIGKWTEFHDNMLGRGLAAEVSCGSRVTADTDRGGDQPQQGASAVRGDVHGQVIFLSGLFCRVL